jgi:hypothetical protein
MLSLEPVVDHEFAKSVESNFERHRGLEVLDHKGSL